MRRFNPRTHRVVRGRAALEATAIRRGDEEHQHVRTWIDWCRLMSIERFPQLTGLHAIPNGGYRMKRTACRLYAEGARAGVSDHFLAAPIPPFHGAYFEAKPPLKDRKLSDHQRQWLEQVADQGYFACAWWGVDAGRRAVEFYFAPMFGRDAMLGFRSYVVAEDTPGGAHWYRFLPDRWEDRKEKAA